MNIVQSSEFSAIVGGKCQSVLSNNSSILGGYKNVIQAGANCSSIIGGSDNIIYSIHPFSAIFGHNLVSCAPNTLHIECLNACATPAPSGGIFPPGTVFRCPTGAILPLGAEPLFIQF
jgi:hypothetical protein